MTISINERLYEDIISNLKFLHLPSIILFQTLESIIFAPVDNELYIYLKNATAVTGMCMLYFVITYSIKIVMQFLIINQNNGSRIRNEAQRKI